MSEGPRRTRGRLVRERPAPPVVVDSSVAVSWFAPEPESSNTIQLAGSRSMLLAPDLLSVEVANVLWKKARRGEMTPAQVEQGITDLAGANLVLVATQPLLIRAARLAIEVQHPVYDCLYLVVAAEWSAQLATLDLRLRTIGERLSLSVWRP